MSDDSRPEPPAPLFPNQVVAGKYELRRRIGVGGMGEIWEAEHRGFEERVAIKVLTADLDDSDEARERFEREARALFKIRSPHVCRVLDVGHLDDGRPFMVMELLHGEDLATLLEDRPCLELQVAVDLALQICEAVAEAHALQIVHRDLKPENVFVTRDSSGEHVLKLLDFGLSKEKKESARRSRHLTGTEQVMGTPHYMAPEQWVATYKVGPAADQWAIATILYEMLVGAPAFDGTNIAEICGKVLEGPTPSLSAVREDLPPGLDAVLQKCLEKEARSRYDSVAALSMALAAYGPPGARERAARLMEVLQQRGHDDDEIAFRFPAVERGSDMRVTERRLDVRSRHSTASSWMVSGRPTSRKARMALIVAASLVLAGAALAVFVLGDEPPVERNAPSPPPARELATTPPEVEAPAPTASPEGLGGVDAATEASGGAAARPTAVPEPQPPMARPNPRPMPIPRPPPAPPPPDPSPEPEDVFDDRW